MDLFTGVFASVNLPFDLTSGLGNLLTSLNLTFQGALLILMLVVIGITAWKGFENILDGFSTMDLRRLRHDRPDHPDRLSQGGCRIHGDRSERPPDRQRFILLIAIGIVANRSFTKDELTGWIWETWKFVKQIFPLLIIGVFAAGIVKVIIPETWVRTIAGQNTIWANAGGRGIWCVHVLPHTGGSAHRQNVPRPGHGARSAAGLPAFRPGTVAAVHPCSQWSDGQEEDRDLCFAGGGISTLAGYLFGLVMAAF